MPSKPIAPQLSYLRSLADRTRQTFVYPRNAERASAEINRLRRVKPSSPIERRIERKQIADQIATRPPRRRTGPRR